MSKRVTVADVVTIPDFDPEIVEQSFPRILTMYDWASGTAFQVTSIDFAFDGVATATTLLGCASAGSPYRITTIPEPPRPALIWHFMPPPPPPPVSFTPCMPPTPLVSVPQPFPAFVPPVPPNAFPPPPPPEP